MEPAAARSNEGEFEAPVKADSPPDGRPGVRGLRAERRSTACEG